MIRAIVVDDERHAREELQQLLAESGEVEVIASCANALEAIREINRLRPELLFLDIEMPLLGGFELLGMIDAERMPHVVFVTAYDHYALKAFEEKTLDYLLKPVEKDRLEKTLAKIKALRPDASRPVEVALPLRRIPCLCAQRIRLIDPAEVECVRAEPGGIYLVTSQGSFFTELTLKVLEERTELLRCHRQVLVNLEKIEEILLLDGGQAELRTVSGGSVPVSRRYLKALKERLEI